MSECSFNDTSSELSDSIGSTSIVTINRTVYANRTDDPQLNNLLTRKHPRFTPQAPKCAKCTKSVYKAEEIRAANKTFHKLCFKCAHCNKLLETNFLTEHQGDLYCRTCYAKNFGPRGYGFGAGAGILSSDAAGVSLSLIGQHSVNDENNQQQVQQKREVYRPSSHGPTLKPTFHTNQNIENSVSLNHVQPLRQKSFNFEKKISPLTNNILGQSDCCARCQKVVYAAEKVNAAGRSFHKVCFNCYSCKKTLNSMNCCDNSDGNVFCKPCYGKQFGPKGVGYGIGAGTLQTTT